MDYLGGFVKTVFLIEVDVEPVGGFDVVLLSRFVQSFIHSNRHRIISQYNTRRKCVCVLVPIENIWVDEESQAVDNISTTRLSR